MPNAVVKASCALSASAVSSCMPLPGVMSSIRSLSASARSSSWVEISTVLFCSCANCRRSRRTLMRWGRSRCAVGSSSRIIGVCCASALAIRIRAFSPSEWALKNDPLILRAPRLRQSPLRPPLSVRPGRRCTDTARGRPRRVPSCSPSTAVPSAPKQWI